MSVHYYTASSLDGFIATPEHDLDWLLSKDVDQDGPMAFPGFIERIGAAVMGANTYAWVCEHQPGEPPAPVPTFVATHRSFPDPVGEVSFVAGEIADLHDRLVEAAAGGDIWVVGGGELAGGFADAGLLDEVWIQYAPVTLGAGAPVLPRRLDLSLIEVARNRDFACARYAVGASTR